MSGSEVLLKGEENLDGKGYIFTLLKQKEMPNGKRRLCVKDDTGKEAGNLIVQDDQWNANKIVEGEKFKILLAKTLKLKNNRPAYFVRDWEKIKKVKSQQQTSFGTMSNSNISVTKIMNLTPY